MIVDERSVSLFHAAQQESGKSVEDVNARLEIQFSLKKCQMFTSGFSSGAFGDSGTRVLFDGTFSLERACRPV